MTAGGAFAIDALLALGPGVDTRAPGGEVTVALCGSWDHAGSCRWPHNSAIDAGAEPAHLRTVAIASDEDRDEIVSRVEHALRADTRWSVVRFATGPIDEAEQALADLLSRTP